MVLTNEILSKKYFFKIPSLIDFHDLYIMNYNDNNTKMLT